MQSSIDFNFNKRARVVCAMSGGVDSSVAALLLKRDGYEVLGVTMKLWDCFKAPAQKTCCSTADTVDAIRVCEQLGISHHVVDMRDAFRKAVVENFASEYSRGRTPNPCIKCNELLKFDLLRRETMNIFGTDLLATGHYARINPPVPPFNKGGNGGIRLLKGLDPTKDQSYFLFTLTQEQLGKTLFPIGDLTKHEVRKMASDAGFKVAEKRESQEICFIPDNDYAGFINDYYPELAGRAGDFVDGSGRIVGRHDGVHAYTVGQRRGLKFGIGKRQYVLKIDAGKNQVVLGGNEDLLGREVLVENVKWTSSSQRIICKIRYRHEGAPAKVEEAGDGRARVIFDKPQRAITPGQAAVFYDGDEVIGGGWIE
ncbi:MAG: tRNA 2-thiouridine(34) synthase MnmA [Deltaproteobacteria bacterium RIFCSPLOWO2_02_FULL_47_10]|nr:MAG: tRNA 2-thiouridine(34) synthase MnmA [Deltaproteobacteria bacterium RIFCSPLOWO2_02_FULL_47_10]